MDWEKIFANHMSDKELISKIYKKLIHINSKEKDTFIKNWSEDYNKYFCKKDIQMSSGT